jgi:hypothetical protein
VQMSAHSMTDAGSAAAAHGGALASPRLAGRSASSAHAAADRGASGAQHHDEVDPASSVVVEPTAAKPVRKLRLEWHAGATFLVVEERRCVVVAVVVAANVLLLPCGDAAPAFRCCDAATPSLDALPHNPRSLASISYF